MFAEQRSRVGPPQSTDLLGWRRPRGRRRRSGRGRPRSIGSGAAARLSAGGAVRPSQLPALHQNRQRVPAVDSRHAARAGGTGQPERRTPAPHRDVHRHKPDEDDPWRAHPGPVGRGRERGRGRRGGARLFAQDDEGNVWNLGEYPEVQEDGSFLGAPHTWIDGVRDAEGGIHMLDRPDVGNSYLQGYAPDIEFLDCATVFDEALSTCVPLRCFEDVLLTHIGLRYGGSPPAPAREQCSRSCRGDVRRAAQPPLSRPPRRRSAMLERSERRATPPAP
jgi:hypothetical protein